MNCSIRYIWTICITSNIITIIIIYYYYYIIHHILYLNNVETFISSLSIHNVQVPTLYYVYMTLYCKLTTEQ